MYRFNAKSRATTSSTAIFLSQQSRQYFSSPRGSDTSFAPHKAQRDLATALRDIEIAPTTGASRSIKPQAASRRRKPQAASRKPKPQAASRSRKPQAASHKPQ